MFKGTNIRYASLVVIFLLGVRSGWSLVNGNEVEVRKTTVRGLREGSVGSFDLTQNSILIWKSGTQRVDIPYASVTKFTYVDRLTRHLGLVPAIAVGMVRKRERKHIFTLTWKDATDVPQLLEVEVSKDNAQAFLHVLRVRAPQVCEHEGNPSKCGVEAPPIEN